jgi:hypothetical protein
VTTSQSATSKLFLVSSQAEAIAMHGPPTYRQSRSLGFINENSTMDHWHPTNHLIFINENSADGGTASSNDLIER